jgi:hypothetical protein
MRCDASRDEMQTAAAAEPAATFIPGKVGVLRG